MSTRARSPLGRETAEQLLRGQPVGKPTSGPAGTDALASLLAAAAAPARSHELAGHRDALAAFRAARLSRARPRRWPLVRAGMARVLAVKTAAAVGAALAAGGIVLAAGTGHFPLRFGHPGPTASTSPSGSPTPAPSRQPTPTSTPSAQLSRLCRDYTAEAASNPGKALQDSAFGPLITAAGGKGRVGAFCAAVLEPGTGNSPNPNSNGTPPPHPTGPPSHPGGTPPPHPTGPPPHPTGPPSHPGHKPSSQPTGNPSPGAVITP